MLNRFWISTTIFLTLGACKSLEPQGAASVPAFNSIGTISLGEPKASVFKKLGPATSETSDKFAAAEYKILEYSKSGMPEGYISIDPDSGKVAGRSIWISEKQPEQEFSYLQTRLFPQSEFETLITCDKHHADEMKVDRKNGIFVGMQKGHVNFVSWSDARLTQLRIDQFFLKCPERQKR